jgi:hypothetical protein
MKRTVMPVPNANPMPPKINRPKNKADEINGRI